MNTTLSGTTKVTTMAASFLAKNINRSKREDSMWNVVSNRFLMEGKIGILHKL